MLVLKCIRAFSQMRNLLNIFSLRHIWPFLSGYIVEVLFQKFWGRLQKLRLPVCMIWFGIFLKIWTFSKQFKKLRNFRRSQRLYSESVFSPFTQEEPMNTEFQDLPNVVSPKEVQTYFGISRSTTYRIFHDASFPAFHIGNRLLVRRDELLDWLEQQKVNKAQNENPKIVGSDE